MTHLLFRLDPPDQHLTVSDLEAEVVAEDLDAVADECSLVPESHLPDSGAELAGVSYLILPRLPHCFQRFRTLERRLDLRLLPLRGTRRSHQTGAQQDSQWFHR